LGGAATESALDLNAVIAIHMTGIKTMNATRTAKIALRYLVRIDFVVILSTRVAKLICLLFEDAID
jgi:hypothetical protein